MHCSAPEFAKVPALTTKRLVVRDPQPGDGSNALGFRSDEEVQRPTSLEQDIHTREASRFIAETAAGSTEMGASFARSPIPRPTSTQTVGVGIVGCGNVAESYLKELGGAKDCHVVGVVSLTSDVARARALLLGAGLRDAVVFASLDELVNDERVDMVVNLSMPKLHASISKRCLENGKHVFSEKPLACNLAEARDVQEAAQLRGLRMGVAPGTFLGRSQQAMLKAASQGLLGRIRHVVADINHGCIELWHPNPQPLLDAGTYADVGPYPVALITKLLGSVLRVSASGEIRTRERFTANGRRLVVETPDTVTAHLTFFCGATMDLNVNSWSTDPNWYSERPSVVEIRGTERGLRLTPPLAANGLVQWVDLESGRTKPFEMENLPALNRGDAFFQLALGALDMKDSIRTGALPQCRLDHAVHLVDIFDAMAESMATGEPVFLNERTGTAHSSWV